MKTHFSPTPHVYQSYKPTSVECYDYFKKYLIGFPYIKPEDLVQLDKYWDFVILKKDESIVLPGEVCQHIVFVNKGYVKHFTDDHSGRHVINFYTQGDFCAAIPSFLNEAPAVDGFTCTELTFGLKINLQKFKILLKERPVFKQLFNELYSHITSNILQRLNSFQKMDAKGRYNQLLISHPQIFNHFAAQDIANYLGIKPETLSRLKKEAMSD